MSGSTTFPPTGPTTLTQILKAYVYQQYSDDEDIQAFNASFNTIAQNYMSFLVNLNLPIYTGLSDSLLDWIAQGLYGIMRPTLQSGSIRGIGPLNTYAPNTVGIGLNVFYLIGAITTIAVNDDIFKRIITWDFFKGDGFYYSIQWLKRRVMRFMVGMNGSAPNIDNTYPISVAFGEDYTITITITSSPTNGVATQVAAVFQVAVASGAVQLPFQYSYTVVVVDSGTGLGNDAGVLQVIDATGWPTSSSGLIAGQLWDSSGEAVVVPTTTPNPLSPPVIFGYITSGALLTLGGANLPLTDPVNAGQLWNNSGIICVSIG